MADKFIRWIKTLYVSRKQATLSTPFADKEFQAILYDKKKQREQAEQVVGKTPMEQIDFTIKNGFEEFNKAYYSEEPKTNPIEPIEEQEPPVKLHTMSSGTWHSISIHSNSFSVPSITGISVEDVKHVRVHYTATDRNIRACEEFTKIYR